jgi:predicted nuclease with RNAse H fold
VRYCGIDVSARAANQQLVTLAEQGAGGLVATFHPPRTPEGLGRTIAGFDEVVVAVDAPSGPRLDLLRPGSALRIALGLPDGRYERMRVCDALLFRRGLPLYPVPPVGEEPTGWAAWIGVGFAVFAALDGLGLYRPEQADGTVVGRVGADALRHGRLCETYPDAVFCSLLGYRPPPKRTREGVRERIAALAARGVSDADGGLSPRNLDELDACAAAYAAYALATGRGSWVGASAEGVIVLPVGELRDRYERRPTPPEKLRG